MPLFPASIRWNAPSMFSRKKPETEDQKMSDAPDDLGIPMKPSRSPGQAATLQPVSRASTPLPPRTPDPARPAGDALRPAETAARPVPPPAQRRNDTDLRRLIVGREISLSGEITSCDKLIVE